MLSRWVIVSWTTGAMDFAAQVVNASVQIGNVMGAKIATMGVTRLQMYVEPIARM